MLRALVIGAMVLRQLALPGVGAWWAGACGGSAAAACCAAEPWADDSTVCECGPAMCGCEGRDEPAPATPARRDRQAEQAMFSLTPPIGVPAARPEVEREVVLAARAGLLPVGGARHQAALCIWRT